MMENEIVNERYELAIARCREILKEDFVSEKYRDYFVRTAEFILLIDEVYTSLKDGSFYRKTAEEMAEVNRRLYEDILPENYRESYAEPDYALERLGDEYAQILSAVYTELRGAIAYAFEKKTEYLDILFELFLEIYGKFEEEAKPATEQVKEIFYWYASDYCDVFSSDRIREQLYPENDFASKIIMNCNLNDSRYLYLFGEYISENELKTAEHLRGLDEETIKKMADVYTEGYRIGFVNTGKDLSKKSIVNIRYVLGFERVVKRAIENFEKMGLKPVIYRSGVSVLTKRQQYKIGYCGAIANKQYEYDHRNDQGLFLDKKFVERKLEVVRTTYEHLKERAAKFAGPACIEMFGEEPFTPAQKDSVVKLTGKQETLALTFDSRQSQIVNEYIRGDERSFTIIAYPVPEIGERYEEIFNEIIKINTLDASVYEKVQQILIDALDQGESVYIKGSGVNRTDLTVKLHPLQNSEKETIFENCVADVNIPVGEVFTSPVLEGTNGVLHVSKVYLNELQYRDLEITFANGMVADYNCKNFEHELENKAYVKDNVLYKHPTLPLGEFAIGTNTTAYRMARDYDIADKLPILIAEKTGPHFAVGDTCYSHAEDVAMYNPDGKEVVARDNSVSLLRKDEATADQAYFNCHTDITIPYDELGDIVVQCEDGSTITIICEGRFVLPGTEELNEELDR